MWAYRTVWLFSVAIWLAMTWALWLHKGYGWAILKDVVPLFLMV